VRARELVRVTYPDNALVERIAGLYARLHEPA
jgi:hypothetical protein